MVEVQAKGLFAIVRKLKVGNVNGLKFAYKLFGIFGKSVVVLAAAGFFLLLIARHFSSVSIDGSDADAMSVRAAIHMLNGVEGPTSPIYLEIMARQPTGGEVSQIEFEAPGFKILPIREFPAVGGGGDTNKYSNDSKLRINVQSMPLWRVGVVMATIGDCSSELIAVKLLSKWRIFSERRFCI